MSGSKRISIGALLILIGFVLVITGGFVGSLPVLGVGSLLFIGGIAGVLWGAFASVASWWQCRARSSPQIARAGSNFTTMAYPFPYPPPVPPPHNSIQHWSQAPSAVNQMPASVAPKQVPVSGVYGVTPQVNDRIVEPPKPRVNTANSPFDRPVGIAVERTPDFFRVAEFIDQYRPSRRFDRELFLQIELAEALRGKFGREAVKTELPIPGGGRIDIEVSGVGVELKIAASAQALRDLPSQLASYREHYGPNLIAVVFDDTGDTNAITLTREATRNLGVRLTVIRHR